MYVIDELSRACYPRSSGRLFFSMFYKTQDDAFRLAAQTWRLSVISQEEFSPAVDGFLEKEVRTEGEFVNAWNSIRTTAQRRRLAVWAGHLLTHASKPDDSSGGLEFRPHGDYGWGHDYGWGQVLQSRMWLQELTAPSETR
jgi:hypothetical protein